MDGARRQWLRQSAAAAAGALLGAPGLTGCASNAPLTVACHPWPGYAPIRLAHSLGWWDDGAVRPLATGSSSESRQALQAGRAQAAALTLDEVLTASAEGLALHVVGLFNLSHGADVVLARPGYTAASRWPGARVGYEAGAVGTLMAQSWLEQAGLRWRDVVAVTVPFDLHETAWRNGAVDLLVTFEPLATRLRRLGGTLVYDSSQLPPERPIVDVLAVRDDALYGHRSALRRLLADVLAAQQHLLNLPVDSAYRLAPWLGLSRDEVPTAFAGLRLTRWEDQRAWLVGTPPKLLVAARALARFLHGAGLRAHGHVPDDLVDARLLPLEAPT
ncbi:MAG: ABC transporter substrate-binding protein [Tepidimonas ignava]